MTAAVELQKMMNEKARKMFLNAHPNLENDLSVDHPIIKDKIANEARSRENETKVAAPTGKQTFKGEVISVKSQDGAYGTTYKMTVKVRSNDGVWLAWGTVPASIWSAVGNHSGALSRGSEVELTATLEAGREPNFAVMQRPRGRLIKLNCGGAPNCSECAQNDVPSTTMH